MKMSVTTSKSTKAASLAHVQALIAGTSKHFPNASFTFEKTAYTTASLVQGLQGLADAIAAVLAAHASVTDALAKLAPVEASMSPVIGAYVRFIRVTLGNAAQDLADFGLAPPKVRAPRTSEQNAAAAAKARATRKARGTTSKKQKLAVKGNVTGVNITPVTEPVPPPAQPAPPK